MTPHKIYTIGNLTIDDIILYDTREMFLESTGGDAIFSAIGFLIWGKQVSVLARKGVDFPDRNADILRQAGITPEFVQVPYRDIRDWALYEPGGARQFINHLSSGDHYALSITGTDISDTYLNGDLYHVAPMPTDVQASVIERLSGAGRTISLDPHVDYLKQAHFNKQAYEMLKLVTFFLPSKEEAVNLFGSDDLEKAARDFGAHGPKFVAIKMSREGSLLYDVAKDQMYHIPIYPAAAIDPTGAGDSYCGGFLAGYLITGDPVMAACYGTVSSSYIVEHVGTLAVLGADFSNAHNRLEVVRNNVTKL